jgi:hypothetical protein
MAKIVEVSPEELRERKLKEGDLVMITYDDYNNYGLVTYVRPSGDGISAVGFDPPKYFSTINPRWYTRIRSGCQLVLEQQ